MNFECRKNQNDADRWFAGELSPDAHQDVIAHTANCRDCAEHYAILEEIASAPIEEPDDSDLALVRRNVLDTIRDERAGWWRRVPHAAGIMIVAGGLLLSALSWFGGRASANAEMRAMKGPQNPDLVLARQIHQIASTNEKLEEVENSPFRYTNVSVAAAEGDDVRLSFDVTRHLDLTLPKSDPLVTEVLVQSVLEAGSVGSQLEAIEQAENLLDPRIRGALVKAMLHDPNLGVRLEAQSKLARQAGDPEIRDALLTVLEKEESVQMRLVAIETLARGRIDPERLREAVESGAPEGRGAVRVKAEQYILASQI